MKNSEKALLIATLLTGVSALLYVKVIEPGYTKYFVSGSATTRNAKYLSLLDRKDEIRAKAKKMLGSSFYTASLKDKQVEFQIHVEKAAKECGIRAINSIAPVAGMQNGKLSLQIEMECPLDSLVKLIYSFGTSGLPVRVEKLRIVGETGKSDTLKVQLELSSIAINK